MTNTRYFRVKITKRETAQITGTSFLENSLVKATLKLFLDEDILSECMERHR